MTDMAQPEFVSTFHVLYKLFITGREVILGRGVRGNSVPCVKFIFSPSFERPLPWKTTTTSFDRPHIACTYIYTPPVKDHLFCSSKD